jgi:hypothetical protein
MPLGGEIELAAVFLIMRYLITTKEVNSPFLTDWFDAENHFNPDEEMVVYDLCNNEFTTDGKTWHKLDVDHL